MKTIKNGGHYKCGSCNGSGSTPEYADQFDLATTGRMIKCWTCNGSGKGFYDLFELSNQEYSDILQKYEREKYLLKKRLRECDDSDRFNINNYLERVESFKPKRIMSKSDLDFWESK